MSWFQMTKVAIYCIGKYLQVSDVEDTITLRKKCPYSKLFWSVGLIKIAEPFDAMKWKVY